MGHGTGYRQIFDGGVHHIAEQTAVLVAVVDIQTGDGMAVAVKCARVGEINSGTIIFRSISNANRRPFLIFQINVRCQHGTDFGFFFGFCIVHLIPEPFQPRGGVDLIGISCGAKAVHVNGVIADSVGHRNAAIHRAAGHGKTGTGFDDKHTVAAIHRRAARDTAVIHGEGAATVYIYTAALLGSAAGDGAAIHGESAGAAHLHRTAVVAGRTIFNRSAVHYKGSISLDKDRTGIVIHAAAADGATVHNKSAAITDIHRTTVIIGFAIRNSAAAHLKFAAV